MGIQPSARAGRADVNGESKMKATQMARRSMNWLPMWAAAGLLSAPFTADRAQAQGRRVLVPEDTVVRLRLETPLGSRDTAAGERFSATLDSADRSGFPYGTRFEGVVVESQRSTARRPGVMDVEFRRALLPDGDRVPLLGVLHTLDSNNLRRTDRGRLESRNRRKVDSKWVGYGAAGGALLGAVLGGGGDWLKGALLGGLGGAAYSYTKGDKREEYRDVTLRRGAEFGMRLEREAEFVDRVSYRYAARGERWDEEDRLDRSDRSDRDYRDRRDPLDDRDSRLDRDGRRSDSSRDDRDDRDSRFERSGRLESDRVTDRDEDVRREEARRDDARRDDRRPDGDGPLERVRPPENPRPDRRPETSREPLQPVKRRVSK